MVQELLLYALRVRLGDYYILMLQVLLLTALSYYKQQLFIYIVIYQ